MATLATLVVNMTMNTAGLTTGAAQSNAALGKLGLGAKSSLGSMVPLAAAAAGFAVVKFASDSVNAARDLVESTNKVNVVFGDQAQGIIDWAEQSAVAFGISDQAALEAAGTFGNLFDAMGLAEKSGAEMSTTLVELASDLASFNNASPEDVLAAMQSGLTGQIRPLRQYGIEISEAALKQEALAQGITKSTSSMTMAEKVQLRYALILKQTGNAQGDFARTSTDLANQQRIAAAQWENLQATLGQLLLPVVLTVTQAFNDLATVLLFATGQLEDFDKRVQDAAINLGEFALAGGAALIEFGRQLPWLGEAIDLWDTYSASQDDATAATTRMGEVVPAALKGVGEAIASLGKPMQEATAGFSKAMKEIHGSLVEEIPAIIGTVTTYKEAFTLSPNDLKKIAASWARIAKTIANDLEAIAESDLKPKMRQAILALPPEMRNAWVEGNAKQRGVIEKSLETTYRISDSIPRLAKQALTGGTTVGRQMAAGIAAGIDGGVGAIVASAISAVSQAIAAARRAAGAASPSKKMAELGADMMEGLIQGMLKEENALLRAAEKVMGALQDKLSKLLGKASSFGQSISGGFSSLFDISGAMEAMAAGTSPVDFFQGQVGVAQQFADVLRALASQGAGPALLSDIASQGPSAIPFAQGLLQTGPEGVAAVNQAYADIAELAATTEDKLTNRFFAERIEGLRDDVRDQKGVLIDIRENIRNLERLSEQAANGTAPVNITVNGWVGNDQDLARRFREELLRFQGQNANSTGIRE